MTSHVHLVVPLKRLASAKTRLAGVAGPAGSAEHARLVLALAADTVAAALATEGVAGLLVVAAAPGDVGHLGDLGAEVVAEPPGGGLNAALAHGVDLLREREPGCVVGALQADLPALDPADLAAAIGQAGMRRAFCPDRAGTGTTLLLSAPGEALGPRFGARSAAAHAASGAVRLAATGVGLRTDVDTPSDLALARGVGLGAHTRAALGGRRRAC